jgi:hypothetical protein
VVVVVVMASAASGLSRSRLHVPFLGGTLFCQPSEKA